MKINAKSVVLVVALSIGMIAGAQGPATQFEVAVVKQNVSGESGWSSNSSNGQLKIMNGTLMAIIGWAYNLRDFQISGGPGWLGADRFDITAKPESGAHEAELKQLLQGLLGERFQLQTHRETKEGAVYALVVEKSGAKLQETANPDHSSTGTSRSAETGRTTLKAEGADMERLIASLSNIVGRPVIDKTGLTAKYDFELSWTPDMGATASVSGSDPSGPSIFTAVQEQLGLRLESQKGPVDVLMIDRVEKPKI